MARRESAAVGTLKRAGMHVLRYLLFLVVGFALCLAFERLSFAARNPLLWRVSALMYSLALVSYPLWCCIRAIADTLRARSTDEEVEVPIAATLLYRGLAAFAVLRSGSFADALVTGTVAARGLSALGAARPERGTAIASRLVIYGICLLVLIEIVIFGCVVGTGEPAQTMLSVIAITIAAAAFACVIIPAVVWAQGLLAERRRFRSRTAWSAGERPVAAGTEALFARNDEKRRAYIFLPRTFALIEIALFSVMILILLIGGGQLPHLIETRYPALRLLIWLLVIATLPVILPALIWWMDCSGRSLTQTIEIDPATGCINYSLTNGSGAFRENVTWQIAAVRNVKVGPRCITVRAADWSGRERTYRIPRTFDDEERFLSELGRLSAAA